MRIVAGRFGGRRIDAPPGRATRPTSDRVREALFSMLGDIEGLDVLDLFAGSGALGFEALSRGAARVDFVERDARALTALRRNAEALGVQAAIHRQDALSFLTGAARSARRWDLILLDPPYSSAGRLAVALAERIPCAAAETAVIVTESDKRAPLELPFPLARERTYGDTRIAIHHVA